LYSEIAKCFANVIVTILLTIIDAKKCSSPSISMRWMCSMDFLNKIYDFFSF